MANFVFNIAKGRVGQLITNVENNSPSGCCLRAILLESSGLESQTDLEDSLTFAEVIDGTTNELDPPNKRKQGLASTGDFQTSLALDTTNNWYDFDISDITWSALTGNAVGALVICYDATGSDANNALLPLVHLTFAVTPDGSDVTAVINAEGIFRAT